MPKCICKLTAAEKKKISAKAKQSKTLKISEMIINYASDYIRLGDTIDQKQSYLNGACAAWNISLLPAAKRKDAVDKFMVCVHPVQIYLDLKGHPERAKEASSMVRQESLKWGRDA